MFFAIIKGIGYLAVFALILLMAHFTSKFVAQKRIQAFEGKSLKIKERVFMSRDKEIVVLSYKDKEYIVGVSGNSISTIDSLPLRDGYNEE
ncbi:flagellar biosynthetic protein FliO [Peptoclostridium acidaminophilum]|uniref:flagellar biosynthetic protein FliO n=1 Tax=Peptoclostridium acidaminophilum TaxID=1731 RepID=UPI00130EA338|nr:flagellar biosynthetic protein FliO [Peptoclostridium acidaminophilum]